MYVAWRDGWLPKKGVLPKWTATIVVVVVWLPVARMSYVERGVRRPGLDRRVHQTYRVQYKEIYNLNKRGLSRKKRGVRVSGMQLTLHQLNARREQVAGDAVP